MMNVTVVSVDVAPRAIALRSYPNPFNPNATIHYSLLETGPAHLAIFDATGRLVRTLVDGARNAGDQ
jgi:hypothetical protein